VLTNFDIYAAGGANQAVIEQFTAVANSSGDIAIAFTNGAANQAEVSGIEIWNSSGSCGSVPFAPTGLSATATSSSTIGLSWTAVTPPANCNISSYNLYRSTTSDFAPSSASLIASGVTGTTYSNTGLTASTTYYYVVEAVDAEGSSAASAQAAAETSSSSCTAVPSAPAGLTATASSSSSITVNWNVITAPANCTISSYSIFRSTTSGFTPSAANLIASGVASPSYTSTGLAASTTYYYAVEAVEADGTSAASAQAGAETSPASSGTEIIAIAAGGPAQSNSNGGDASFVADEDLSGGGDNAVASATLNLAQPGANAAPMAVYQHARSGVFTYTIPGLTAGGTYTVLLHFAETYFTAVGDREFNVAINGTTVLANLDIYAAVGLNAALLEQFSTTANSSGDIVIAFTAGVANQPVVSGIEVRGSSGGGCSAVPPAPTGLTATATSSASILLNWTGVTPPANCTIGSYNVYRSTAGGFTPSASTPVASGVSGPSYTNTGLTASTTYYYVVEALDAEGNSAPSSQTSATTPAVSSEILAIACGGPAESNSGGGDHPFVADEDFSGGGDNSVSSSKITSPSPVQTPRPWPCTSTHAPVPSRTRYRDSRREHSIPCFCISPRRILPRRATVNSMSPSTAPLSSPTSTSTAR
jgi:hypothetical protein